jgi:glycosyltransferase involved in cell wall biosynthesis
MRVLIALSGLHRVSRGAEIAFESMASRLAERPDCRVTLVGSGGPRDGQRYQFMHVPCTPRERFEHWPRMPLFRDHYVYEEFTFARRLWSAVDPSAYDVTVTCSYPFVNWMLRARRRQRRPRHVFVTQNGDWPAHANRREYRFFACDGLVCTNPDYLERNRERWPCELIPNGVDVSRFRGVTGDRGKWGLPAEGPMALIVSALTPSKRVIEGVRAAAMVPELSLLVVGDGELRDQVDAAGRELMPGRFRRVTLPYDAMPGAYASANVLLHMSKDEPFGNVYIEALAAGLPVVAHDWTGTRWILGEHGTLVDTEQPERVAKAILGAVDDPSGAAARRSYVESRFGWHTVAEQYAAFFRRILEDAT